MKAYTDHPIANIFPLLEADKLAELAADIGAHGLKQDITLYDGQILDGRTRYRACLQAGVNPTFVVYAGNDAVGHVLSLNLHRRHLTASQLATVATESLPHYEAEAKKRRSSNGGDKTAEVAIVPPAVEKAKARDQADAAVGRSARYVSDAKRVKAEAPEVFEKVKSGELTLPKAMKELRAQAEPVVQQENEPQPEPEVEDEPTFEEAAPLRPRLPVLRVGRQVWAVAKGRLDTITPKDAEREEVLREVIAYATHRLQTGK